ncbi:BMC_2a_G0053760.mRNA.1.CDS.1 [Saccharomyces cerevisiae]|nr:Coa2p [Saccharomyces cerevisiae YJM1447]CAI4752918.1 BMC_2a_G0053760.mRNA.1.CDS.1 [Saccharomyces cerevisiae]CAI4760094.1 BMB_G0053730.mRNA.1.CDS.1 [Saccharomyces cerevisiae]CAI7326757.1 BMC_2a_G0053760.mRNA.1.CDS.1 [Saccharomyces cerevisiae]CAI7329872.1 BMB_G0053730.mRNA.1.CDS.1 [Saccharomyces cerevisiae]
MRAVTRNKIVNNLYFSTFLIAFASVAIGSVLPCSAHSVDSDSPAVQQHKLQLAHEQELKRKDALSKKI